MSGRRQLSFVDFIAFSSEVERVRCVMAMSFLVRNWCGARLVVAGNDRIVAFDAEAIAKERFGDTTCVNLLLIGDAWQQGLIPVSERD
jgi:hypothetical protein